MASAKDLENGNYFLYNNEIMKVIRKELIAYGTHSHTKLKIIAQTLFSRGEKAITMTHNDKVEILDIMRKEAQVVSKLSDKVQIMDIQSYETFDADLDKELLNRLNEGDIVTFITYNGKNKIIEKR